MANTKKPRPTTKPKPVAPYISGDIALLAHVPPDKRAEIERMYATTHMAIPNLGKKAD